jgi:hypothetical protein
MTLESKRNRRINRYLYNTPFDVTEAIDFPCQPAPGVMVEKTFATAQINVDKRIDGSTPS